MTRPTPEFRMNIHPWAFYVGTLSPLWEPIIYRPPTLSDALGRVDIALRGGLTPDDLRRLANRLGPIGARTSDDEVRNIVARALLGRQICILLKNERVRVGRADPAVFAAVNTRFSTRIDFNFLAQWEGGQWLHGYVPFTGGRVAGKSGVTIATGFDIGQRSAASVAQMGLAPDLAQRISPFADHQFKRNGVSLTPAQVMAELLAIGAPVPKVTVAEANTLDQIVHGEHVEAAKNAWNGARAAGVPAFTALPEPWQTVIFSRFYHQGMSAHRTGVMRPFWTAATTGQWDDAIVALTNYAVSQAWYRTRVRQEAAHLATAKPAAVPAPAPRPAAARPGAARPGAARPAAPARPAVRRPR